MRWDAIDSFHAKNASTVRERVTCAGAGAVVVVAVVANSSFQKDES